MKKKMAITLAAASMAVLSAALLTGCGKSGSSPEGGNKEDNKLNVYNWGEYIDEDVITQFEEETGIQVVYDVFETNEEMYPVIEAGAVNYDAVCPSDYMIQKMVENGLLAEINFENVPNIANIDPVYLEKSKAFDPENRYSVPYTWGTVGIIYNVQKLEELGVPAPTKWSDLWDERLKGEILMQDSVRDAFMVALKALGYSMNTSDADEIQAAYEWLLDMNNTMNPTYVTDEVIDGMANGNKDIAIVYSGDATYVQSENEDMSYWMPKEGTNLWYDAMVVPKNAQNPLLAQEFINYTLTYEAALGNSEYVGYTSPNEEVMLELSGEEGMYGAYEAYIPRSGYDKDEVFQDNPILKKKIAELWIKVKASKG